MNLTPREIRIANHLMQSPTMREAVDRITAASNGPDVIHRMRKKGFEAPCELLPKTNRFGERCHAGQYHFTEKDKRLFREFLAASQSTKPGESKNV